MESEYRHCRQELHERNRNVHNTFGICRRLENLRHHPRWVEDSILKEYPVPVLSAFGIGLSNCVLIKSELTLSPPIRSVYGKSPLYICNHVRKSESRL
jgi:hypothetical protein